MKGPTLLQIWLKISIANYHKVCIWIFNEDFSVSTYQILQSLNLIQSSYVQNIAPITIQKRPAAHITGNAVVNKMHLVC